MTAPMAFVGRQRSRGRVVHARVATSMLIYVTPRWVKVTRKLETRMNPMGTAKAIYNVKQTRGYFKLNRNNASS